MKIWRSEETRGERYLARVERRGLEAVSAQVEERARRVVAAVAKRGDRALVGFVRRYDLRGMKAGDLRLHGEVAAGEEVSEDFIDAVELALENLKAFHEPQLPKGYALEQEGNDLSIRVRPIESVGVFLPSGAGAAIAALLMAVVPARIAGVSRIAVATPPRAFLSSRQLRYVLDRLDLREVYLMGGAHAIAALAYGTDSVTPVDKIVGSGGRLVAAAKRAVSGRVDVDASDGPAEIVIVADSHAEPDLAAADLLAQAAHDPDALAVLLTPSKTLAERIDRRVGARLRALPKGAAARIALRDRGAILLVPDLEAAIEVVNRIAPTHVELLVGDPLRFVEGIERAGMIHLGPFSAVALGDFGLGSNHRMPTGGAARFSSPLGVWDFVQRIGVVRVAPHRYAKLARAAAALAADEAPPLRAESLRAGSRGRA